MESIGATYDAVLEEVQAAVDLRQAILRRMGGFYGRGIRERIPFFLRGHPEHLRKAFDEWSGADERRHRYYAVVTSERFIESLAATVCAQFKIGADEAAELTKLHGEREAEITAFMRHMRLVSVAGIAFAAAALLASQVPKDSFEALGWEWYGWYRLTVFCVLIFLLLYVGWTRLWVRRAARKAASNDPLFSRNVRDAMRLMLLHCEFRTVSNRSSGREVPERA